MQISKVTKHYGVTNRGEKRGNRWRVVHVASRSLVTSLGPFASYSREQAERFARECELVAPTKDAHEAGARLLKSGLLDEYRREICGAASLVA